MWQHVVLFWFLLEASRHSSSWTAFLFDNFGVTVHSLTILCETSKLNALLNKLGESAWFHSVESDGSSERRTLYGKVQSFLDVFYVLGVFLFFVVQLVLFGCLFVGTLVPLYELTTQTRSISKISEQAPLRPVVPGYNVPTSDAPLIMMTLLITLSFHELGHALSASTERVRTEGCGFFVALIVPGAFVRLEQGLISQLSPRSQLKVIGFILQLEGSLL